MKIIWTITDLTYSKTHHTATEIPELAERIWASATTTLYPPEEIRVSKLGYGNYLFDLLKEKYNMNVVLID